MNWYERSKDILDEFFVDGRLKVGLKKRGNERVFYEAFVKNKGPNIKLIFHREDGSVFEMDLYNVKRFFAF